MEYKTHGTAAASRPLPKALVIGISLGILFHLAALAVLVTAAPSGPWSTPVGPSPALAPEFAGASLARLEPFYFQPLQLTHNYHYMTDQVENWPAVSFEVTLKDEKGNIIDTVQFPQRSANPWLRQRQRFLAQNLAADTPVMRRPGEKIAAPGKKLDDVTIWERGEKEFTLKKISPLLVPENQPVSRPTEWAQILAKSYMRYLCRKHGAASATLLRTSYDPISPVVLVLIRAGENVPAALLGEEMKANFGEYRVAN